MDATAKNNRVGPLTNRDKKMGHMSNDLQVPVFFSRIYLIRVRVRVRVR